MAWLTKILPKVEDQGERSEDRFRNPGLYLYTWSTLYQITHHLQDKYNAFRHSTVMQFQTILKKKEELEIVPELIFSWS